MTKQEMAEAYQAGATIEEIHLDSGRDPKTVRKYLVELGVEIRPARQRHGTKPRRLSMPNAFTENIGKSKSKVPTARIVRPSAQRMYR